MGPVGQMSQVGSKDHMCRLRSPVLPVAHLWVWGAGCHGDGRSAELGRDWEYTAMLGGLIL